MNLPTQGADCRALLIVSAQAEGKSRFENKSAEV